MSAAGSALELKICEATGAQRMLEFDYVQVNADSRSGGHGYGKLWTVAKMENLRVVAATFDADDPDYNPNDTALLQIHCGMKPPARSHGHG